LQSRPNPEAPDFNHLNDGLCWPMRVIRFGCFDR
jgi:hypothetical protein